MTLPKSGQASSTMQPRSSKVWRCASSTLRTRRSSGSPPRSSDHATRVPRQSRSNGPANDADRIPTIADRAHRRRRSTLKPNATSATDRAIAPFVDTPTNGIGVGALGTRPTLGRSATMLLKLAGLRSEPPRSPPSAIGSMPVASADARPRRSIRPRSSLRSYGLQRRPVDRVVGLRAHPELGHVGLADRNRAGAPDALDEHRIRFGHERLEDRRALALRKSDRRLEILERGRQPVQRPDRAAVAERAIGLVSQRETVLVIELRDDGVEIGIEA